MRKSALDRRALGSIEGAAMGRCHGEKPLRRVGLKMIQLTGSVYSINTLLNNTIQLIKLLIKLHI